LNKVYRKHKEKKTFISYNDVRKIKTLIFERVDIMTTNFSQLDEVVDNYRGEMIEFQRLLTSIPALDPTSGGEGEIKKVAALKEWLEKKGITQLEEYRAPDARVPCGYRPSLVATIPGAGKGPRIWMLSHTDVVPTGDLEKWDTDPWVLKEEDGLIYGRGVEDNQQGLTSSVFAALTLVKEGITPPGDVKLLFVADEETGSHYGLLWFVKNHPQLFTKEDLILVPDFGSPDSTHIEVAEKSILWAKFSVLGKQSHASRPASGNNAHRAGAQLLLRLDDELHKKFDAKDELYKPPESTFEPTMKLNNVPNFNTIPPEDIFCFDCRVLPNYQLDDVKKLMSGVAMSIEGQYKVKVNIEYVQSEQAPPPTAVDSPIVVKIIDAVKEVYGTDAKPVGIGGGTVAAGFRSLGIPAAVWATLEEKAHQSNEYCRVDNMVNDAKVMLRLMLKQ
jgi:succinyl-diaminopimelate desuccinylase